MEECSMKGSGQTQLALTTEKKKRLFSKFNHHSMESVGS